MKSGGDQVAEVLLRQGVRFLFTLCGGHISPILAGAKSRGLRVVDVRHEVNAVFAADAVGRLTGRPGVAAVTAGPGVTNALTALQNARLAGSPLVLLAGAAATATRGRGALQDIDQLGALAGNVKWATGVTTVRDLAPTLEEAFSRALAGVPGPVCVECPIDLLYPEAIVRDMVGKEAGRGRGVVGRAIGWYLGRHLDGVFAGRAPEPGPALEPAARDPLSPLVARAARRLASARKPLLLVGSQALRLADEAPALAEAIERLGVPTWLAGMARGLLGRGHPLHRRHARRAALADADLVILAGVPADFRLQYGLGIPRRTPVVAANLDVRQLFLNRVPTLPVPADPGRFLQRLAARGPAERPDWSEWLATLRARDVARDEEIAALAEQPAPPMNPLALCRALEAALPDDSVLVADGGDFVATASYIVRPRAPLSWLDPGAFGTLGVGAGFALAAALCRPEAETWLLWGDGAAGFSLLELDTFARHGLPVIAVIGNDAGWSQIARDQVELLGDDVATGLAPTAYDRVAEGLGAVGLSVDDVARLPAVLAEAREAARKGRPVLINARIGRSSFRKGSISV